MIQVKLISRLIDKFYIYSLFMKLVHYKNVLLNFNYSNMIIWFAPLSLKNSFSSLLDLFLFGFLKGYKHYLEFCGTGYKFKLIDAKNYFGLILRLGYSHLIYIDLMFNFRVKYLTKSTFLFYNHDLWALNNNVYLIKIKKRVNAYKKKGILSKNSIYLLKKSSKLKF